VWWSVNPTDDNAWRADAQIRLMRSGTKSSTLMIPVAAFFVQLTLQPWVPSLTRNVWWIAVLTACVILDLCNRRIDKLPARNTKQIARKARLSVLSSLFFYLAWCSMGIVLWVPGQTDVQLLLVVFLACSMAGATIICAAHPATAVTALVCHMLALAVPTIFGGTRLDLPLTALSGVFIFVIASQLVGISSGINRMLRLDHERLDMVRSLRTAQRDTEQEHRRAIAAGKAKSQFLSNMNHELRTPMNAILGFSELIQTKAFGEASDRYSDYAAIIHDSGKHLLSLIDGMLDLAKIEGGKLSLKEVDIDVAMMMTDLVAEQTSRAAETSLNLEIEVPRGLPRLYADERGLRQIIANLLSNAIKFTQPGGTIHVFARAEADGSLALGVQDSGPGIAKDDQQHVFERFGKGRHDVTTENKGTGLGLAIVKGFAEAHDGRVELQSEIGVGTRVTVHFPRERVIAGYTAQIAV
jgi:signal transduction histidine kinase